jgi:hypothetical protein
MKQARLRRLQVISISWVLSIVSGSVTPQSPSRTDSSSAVKNNPVLLNDDPGDTNNDFFKQKEDWWKDPFAMFDEDDDEGDEGMVVNSATNAVEEENEDDEEELLLMSEPEIPTISPAPQPQELPPPPEVLPPPAELPPPPEFDEAPPLVQELSAIRTRKEHSVNPLIEQTIKAPVEHFVSAGEVRANKNVVAKFGSILRAVPFAQVLLSFAFVKVVQPVMLRIGNEYENKAMAASEKKTSDQHQNEDFDDRRPAEEEERRYPSQSPQHKPLTRRGAAPSPVGWFGRVFGAPSEPIEKLPPARDLMDQVEYLQLELATIKSEKESMEREYEKASWQVSDLLYNYVCHGRWNNPTTLTSTFANTTRPRLSKTASRNSKRNGKFAIHHQLSQGPTSGQSRGDGPSGPCRAPKGQGRAYQDEGTHVASVAT